MQPSENYNKLFVYGTLRSASEHPMSRLLNLHSRSLGKAYFRGRLYDIGSYPGAVPSDCPADKVLGELFELQHPDILPKLDYYEGYQPSQPAHSLFIRKKRRVHSTDPDKGVKAWIYLYNRSVEGLPMIPGGNYLSYLQG